MKNLAVLLFLAVMTIEQQPALHTFYLPVVRNNYGTNPKTGYAWSPLSVEETNLLKMSWYHHWDVGPRTSHTNGAEFIHHFSCNVRPYSTFDDDARDQFQPLRELVALKGEAQFYLLFLNEPDLSGQCNVTPSMGVAMYKKVIEIAPNAIIVGPQTSHLDYNQDWLWLREWYRLVNIAKLPHPAIASIHAYLNEDPSLIVDSHFSVLEEHGVAIDKVWISEFGSSTPEGLYEMIKFYQTDERVERYSYFAPNGGGEHGGIPLLNDGELTPYGLAWVSAH